MRKNVVIIFFLATIIFVWFYAIGNFLRAPRRTYIIEGKKYNLLEARTPPEWERGLMHVKKVRGVDGMIFLFPDKKKRQFWNKNTYLDLEIIWMDDEKIVGKSYLPSITKSKKIVTVTSPQPINKVVELISVSSY